MASCDETGAQNSPQKLFADAALRFGVDNIREHQLEVCLQYFKGQDSFFIAPTGFGKSLVYQVAALVFNISDATPSSRVLIVQPTVALIDDSIKKLKQYVPELSAVHLTPATVTRAKSATYIFTSPEMILSKEGRNTILTDSSFMSSISAVFVDECHIIEEWGVADKTSNQPAFRALYSKLGELRSFTSCPFVAMTATADIDTIGFIKQSLNMQRCRDTKIDVEKKNISYHVVSASDDDPSNLDFLAELLLLNQGTMEKTLVFFNNMKTLTEAYTYVREAIGQRVGDLNPLLGMYMSVTSAQRKDAIINELNDPDGSTRVVFCTSSLAVGVNVSNVKYIFHYGAPKLVQDFLQETGRSARESASHGHSILIKFPRMNSKGLGDTMKAYVKGESCRRLTLLKLFGSSSSQTKSPKCCDVCNPSMDYSFKTVINAYFSDKVVIQDISDSSLESEPSIGDIDVDQVDPCSD